MSKYSVVYRITLVDTVRDLHLFGGDAPGFYALFLRVNVEKTLRQTTHRHKVTPSSLQRVLRAMQAGD